MAGANRSPFLQDMTRAEVIDAEPAREPPRVAPNENARPERHGLESLDSLAVDIARMIDHDAAAELWDRYKRGERNVFTRKLYTMQGQKAFEEIRKRYRADGDFRRTVDRYIGEFERLLEEVSRDDRDQMLTRTYLTSETGKVYTMLAHAAGLPMESIEEVVEMIQANAVTDESGWSSSRRAGWATSASTSSWRVSSASRSGPERGRTTTVRR